MDIQLVPHVGWQDVPGRGKVEVKLPQDMIFIDGVFAGYVGHHKGAGVAITAIVSEAEIHHIRKAIDVARGEMLPERPVVTPPTVGENALPQEAPSVSS